MLLAKGLFGLANGSFCPSADFAYIHTCIIDFVSTLEEIEELLDPRKFYRANRQFIVNIDAIQNVLPHENQKLTLTLKSPLKMEVDISRESPGI